MPRMPHLKTLVVFFYSEKRIGREFEGYKLIHWSMEIQIAFN